MGPEWEKKKKNHNHFYRKDLFLSSFTTQRLQCQKFQGRFLIGSAYVLNGWEIMIGLA
jgi:hypothetical protein